MNKKLNFVCVIDRLDYFSGMNHSFHSLASVLHDLGENVYTFGTGKPGYKYKIFEIEGFDPKVNVLPEISEIDLKLNGLETENTVFISCLFDLPFLAPYKQAKWMEFFDDNYEFNDNNLYFYHLEGYCRSGRKYDGPLRFFDMDPDFWHSTSSNKTRNSFLIKKLIRKRNEMDIDRHIQKGLIKLQALSPKLPFDQMDNIAGLLDHHNDSYEKIRPVQRDIWSQSDYFLTFDEITAQPVFATLCGAKSIIVPESDRYKPDEFRELFYPYSTCGVAYGFNDLSHMYKTASKTRQHCLDAYDTYVSDVRNLIKTCYEKF